MSVSRLMEYLDPDAKSANPVNAIQAQIGRLRRSIEPGISGRDAVHLRSIGNGYALIPDTMDLWDFRELVAQGARLETTDPRRAVEVQSQALDMFAAPLGELADNPLIVGFVASVVGEEMALRDDWMESLLRAGLAVEHVDKMVSAVRSEPTRERRCVHAMHALCRAGRQADALRLHEEVRIVLRDELGVSPGDGLREMHSRVLAQDPTLHSRHTSVDGDMDRDTTSFVGRREELNTMSDLLDRHRVVTVCGLSGVGKSRLARQWLDQNYRLARAIWVRVPAAEAGADAPDVTEALSEALGLGELTEQADRVDRWGSARASLPHNSILVVIDGAENNLDDAARVVLELCDARPGVSVLVTSQVPLGISGEQVMLLNPLPMPEVDGSLEGTAVQLAQDRLGQGVGLRTAIELSERCGGLPLVVEMAAKIPEAVLGDPSYA
ncbi:MAG TPA: BTAD domain-containing putative transcriptional regulator, partial [Microthrixaceae bacterium]|nr:BTAD domain-containing putative transcriptional regulator [Microthrixaceae bacterium]